MNIYICDIDGTIANNDHREHLAKAKDWDAFFDLCGEDEPIEHMRKLICDLAAATYFYDDGDGHEDPVTANTIVYVTGRPERVRGRTIDWMDKHGFPGGHMFMRQDGDHRPDHIMKVELLTLVRTQIGEPLMAFDDRNAVVAMWRAAGVPCMHVTDKGDF